jgi:hypothetical protein
MLRGQSLLETEVHLTGTDEVVEGNTSIAGADESVEGNTSIAGADESVEGVITADFIFGTNGLSMKQTVSTISFLSGKGTWKGW